MAAEGRNRAVGKRFTVADVRRAYSPEKALDERFNQWPVYYGPRILSFYLTPSLLNAGLGPATVTVWALLLALALPWLALAPLPWAIWGVAVGGPRPGRRVRGRHRHHPSRQPGGCDHRLGSRHPRAALQPRAPGTGHRAPAPPLRRAPGPWRRRFPAARRHLAAAGRPGAHDPPHRLRRR